MIETEEKNANVLCSALEPYVVEEYVIWTYICSFSGRDLDLARPCDIMRDEGGQENRETTLSSACCILRDWEQEFPSKCQAMCCWLALALELSGSLDVYKRHEHKTGYWGSVDDEDYERKREKEKKMELSFFSRGRACCWCWVSCCTAGSRARTTSVLAPVDPYTWYWWCSSTSRIRWEQRTPLDSRSDVPSVNISESLILVFQRPTPIASSSSSRTLD